MRLVRVIILIIVCGVGQSAFAQDMHFTQFYASPLYLNPAFAGAHVCSRVSFTHRNQWPGISTAYKSYLGSFDHYIAKSNLGVGMMFASDVAGTGNLRTTQIQPIIAYEANLSRQYTLRLGLQPGVTIKSVNMNSLTFGDQITRGGNVATLEDPVVTKAFLDLGAGLLFYSKYYWIGTSAYHLNRPNEGLYTVTNAQLPIRYLVHGGYKYNISEEDEKESEVNQSITAAFNYRGQDKFDQVDIGAYYTRGLLNLGLWYRGIPLLKSYQPGYKNNDAAAVIIGLVMPQFQCGYSYDLTISELKKISSGAHEITMSVQLCKQTERKKKGRVVSCPKF